MPRNVLLIGSIPLGTAERVFETVGRELAGVVRRVPDGENGERLDWVAWQSAAFARIPFIERIEADRLVEVGLTADRHGPRFRGPQYRVRPGFPTAAVRLGPLGYADAAAQSYRAFARAKATGALPAECRLQVGVASALSVVGQYIDGAFQAAIEPAYERRLLEEVDEIAAAVPADELAIQWNLATELSIVEGHRPVYFDKVWDGILERVVRGCERVPKAAELGLHFCFRDFEYQGFPLPADLDRIVDLANGISGLVGRSIEWMHFPVPETALNEAWFSPLRGLTLRPETDLYLGVVHAEAGPALSQHQMTLASRHMRDFGIACACGIGDIAAGAVADLLQRHRVLAEAALPART